jgi:general secretion pathway protein L
MAAAFLKRTQWVIWVPPRSIGERAFASQACLIAMQSDGTGPLNIQRLSLDALPKIRQAAIVFDARDVSLVAVQTPALAAAKLAKALPALIEDQLLQDVGSCALTYSAPHPGTEPQIRTIAAIDAAWLEFVLGAFERRGIQIRAAWPASLSLPMQPAGLSVACVHSGIALRHQVLQGLGWHAGDDPEFRTEALVQCLASVTAPGQTKPVVVFAEDPSWRVVAERAAQRLGLTLNFAGLPWVQGAPIDLRMARAGSAPGRFLAQVDWNAWRLPAAMAAVVAVVGLAGLNLHWGQLLQERNALRVQLDQSFRQAFPSAQVVVDPVLQAQRLVSNLRARAGKPGPDDFGPLLNQFALALGPKSIDALTAADYRDGKLRLTFNPTFVESRSAREEMRASARQAGLILTFENEREPVAIVGAAR